MRSGKLSIAALMSVVLFTGIGFAALSHPTRFWAALLLSSAGAILTVATLAGLFARGPRRAFWGGFAIVGWVYLVMHGGTYVGTESNSLPNAGLDVLYYLVSPPPPAPAAFPAPVPAAFPTPAVPIVTSAPALVYTPAATAAPPATPAAVVPPPPAPGTPVFSAPFIFGTLAPSPTPLTYWTGEDLNPASSGYGPGNMRPVTPTSFYEIGNALLSLIVALVGGWIAKRIATTAVGASDPKEARPELAPAHQPDDVTQFEPPERPRA